MTSERDRCYATSQFSNLSSDNTFKTNNREGLGTCSETQPVPKTTFSMLAHGKMEEIDNCAVGGCGVASGSKQHMQTVDLSQKVLTKTQRRNLRRRCNKRKKLKESSIAWTGDVDWRHFKGHGTKIFRPDDSPSSSTLDALMKPRMDIYSRSFAQAFFPVTLDALAKPRMDIHPRSFTQQPSPVTLAAQTKSRVDVHSTTRLAITKKSFPAGKLSEEEVNLIQTLILDKVDSTPMGEQLPKINRTNLKAGALILFCDNASTVEWVKKSFHGNGHVLDGEILKVSSAKKLFKPIKVAFKTRDMCTKEAKVILKRLNKYNPELNSLEWHFIQQIVDPHSVTWIFEVGLKAAEAIQKSNFRAYTGLDKGTFKFEKDQKPRQNVNSVKRPVDRASTSWETAEMPLDQTATSRETVETPVYQAFSSQVGLSKVQAEGRNQKPKHLDSYDEDFRRLIAGHFVTRIHTSGQG